MKCFNDSNLYLIISIQWIEPRSRQCTKNCEFWTSMQIFGPKTLQKVDLKVSVWFHTCEKYTFSPQMIWTKNIDCITLLELALSSIVQKQCFVNDFHKFYGSLDHS